MNPEIAAQVKMRRAWNEKSGERILRRSVNYLVDDLKQGRVIAIQQAPESLLSIGLYYGSKGIVECFDGNASGLVNIRLSIDYYAWASLLQSKFYLDNKSGRTVGTPEFVPLLACVACLSQKWSSSAMRMLERLHEDEYINSLTDRTAFKFERFVRRILTGNNEISVEGLYSEVVENWDKPLLLAKSLQDLCAYHVARIQKDINNEFYTEFKYPPFDLLPCELILVQMKRQEKIQLNHDLLNVGWEDLSIDTNFPYEGDLLKLIGSLE